MRLIVLATAWTVTMPVLALINIVQLSAAIVQLLWMFIHHIFEMPFEAWKMCREVYDKVAE